MTRTSLQRLAEARLREASILFDAGEYSGAYYLAGYALECGLKACIARLTRQYDFPDKKLVQASYTHKLSALLIPAKLEISFTEERERDATFAAYWSIAAYWTEESRYEEYALGEAGSLLLAIVDKRHGCSNGSSVFGRPGS